jgi:hypothetical protein
LAPTRNFPDTGKVIDRDVHERWFVDATAPGGDELRTLKIEANQRPAVVREPVTLDVALSEMSAQRDGCGVGVQFGSTRWPSQQLRAEREPAAAVRELEGTDQTWCTTGRVAGSLRTAAAAADERERKTDDP